MERTLTFLLRRVLPALAIAALLVASLRLAEDTAGEGSSLAAHYRGILAAAAAALLVLAAAIGLRLWRLGRDLARNAPGARLNRRLLRLLLLLALPSTVIVYGFALRFLHATIDNWFDVRLEQALGEALELGRIVVDEHLASAEAASTELAARLADAPAAEAQDLLDEAIDRLGAIQLAVLASDGRVEALASSDPRYLSPPLPDAGMLVRIEGDRRFAAAEPLGGALALRVVLPLDNAAAPRPLRMLQGIFPLPERLQPLTQGIERANFDFQRLKFLRGSLKLTFALILTFVLLLSLLVAVLAAFGMARRLVAPIGRLAAATRAVGAGRYDTPLPSATDDELGFLVTSFGQMTQALEQASARAQKSARENEQQRAWLGAVLERLSAGVLGFDGEGCLRVANRAAESILGVELGAALGHPLAAIRHAHPDLAVLLDPLARHLREGLEEWREEVSVPTGAGMRTLMIRGTALPGRAGYVAVFDDLTVLNRVQRDAAWGEVARRLAHEVKNPLTPIQLAAERLRRRFLGRLPAEEGEVIDRATRTIVGQVEALKAMVNAFGDYARPPQLPVQPIALHALLGEVLDLYENDQRIVLDRRFAAAEPHLRVDAVRLRQALHNLLKNALEAIGDERKPHIRVSTCILHEHGRAWVELAVADNGPGLPEDFGERWYEPYTSSKERGTGLGLAVVKKIAEEHGGSVEARKGSLGGAEFALRLPLA